MIAGSAKPRRWPVIRQSDWGRHGFYRLMVLPRAGRRVPYRLACGAIAYLCRLAAQSDARSGARTVLWDRHPDLAWDPSEVPRQAVTAGRAVADNRPGD